MTLRRRTPLKRSPMRRKAKSTSYARRERDVPHMMLVKSLPCLLHGELGAGRCSGEVQADHAGLGRGLGQKADDRTCIPLCRTHHQHRTDSAGFFKSLTREERRHWIRVAIARTELAIAEKLAGVRPHAESRRP
ncbi:MAG: hypothetical protein M3Q39_16825 [Actinomycetota bacterium]|nr:hypothetical protein [Actinomycetota bacterium]